jgi:hypothetical protein
VFGWLRKQRLPLHETPYDVALAVYPFSFPVLSLSFGSWRTHASLDEFGETSESVARGQRLDLEVFAGDARRYRATGVIAATDLGRKIFNQAVCRVVYSFGRPVPYELAGLKRQIIDEVENDSDDLWDQFAERHVLIAALEKASSFEELVSALRDVAGR